MTVKPRGVGFIAGLQLYGNSTEANVNLRRLTYQPMSVLPVGPGTNPDFYTWAIVKTVLRTIKIPVIAIT